MIYGYARVSTRGQARDGNSLEQQERLLKENGAEEIFKDSFTGTKTSRPQFDQLLEALKSGDRLVVTKLDRFARTARDGMALIQNLQDRGVIIHILNMGLIDDSPTGKLITQIMLAFAEFERDLIVERTREGKAIARQRPGFREGRPRKFSDEQIECALDLLKTNSYSKVQRITGISKTSLVRARREAKAK